MLFFLSEIQTKITAEKGRIWIEQVDHDGHTSIVELTIRQFMAIVDQQNSIVDDAVKGLP